MTENKTNKPIELIDRERTLQVIEGVTEGAVHTESVARNEGAQLVRALVIATLKSKSLVPTVAQGQTEEVRTYNVEMYDNDAEAVETVPLEKVAKFLGRNYEPPYWYRNISDMLSMEKRQELERRRLEHPEDVWKEVLRAAALKEDADGDLY